MKSISKDEARIIMLGILDNFDLYCKKHNLIYWLESGTLLGAIRHKGFIPWDDDIDVGMPRPDYERLLKFSNDEQISDNIKILYPENNIFPYIKLIDTRTILIEYPKTLRNEISIYIDVFPKDGLPKNSKIASILCFIVEFFNNFYWFNKYSVIVWKKSHNIIKKIIAYVFSPICKNKLFPLNISLSLSKMYDYSSAKYIATILAGGMANAVEKSCFDSFIDAEFEGKKYPIPIGYDKYLRKLYSHINNGDYMQLPPENKKIIHKTEMYWK